MIGTRLGAYEIVAELGSGGMGRVYRGTTAKAVAGLEPGCAVAIKVIHAHLLETEGFFQRFLREADIGRAVAHENVVRTYLADATLHEGVQQNFLVMEYVEGQTLRDLLQELERVPEELCRHIGREVAKGLAAIHEADVVHRDLKPENVLITPDHEVKIMDLGVARLRDESIRLSQTGAFVGSLEYAAPEQFRSSDGEPDGRADLHALGVVLYELATGQHPYRDEDVSRVLAHILNDTPRKAGELNPQLSPFFEEVVHTLIAKERDERFASASDLATVLEESEESAWWKARAKALRVETKRPLRRIRIPRETALYGRDDDLAWMQAAYEMAKAGDGQVLLIEGEAGIGKTRLVDEFVGRLRQEGEDVNFLFGSYPPGGAATASGAFSEAYREQFGAEDLETTLADYLTVTPLLVPSFAALLKGDAPPKDAESLTKDSLQTVFVHATRGLAAERTTIVLIDDLHFAPEDGRSLFSSLAMAAPEHRILLIGTVRPGVPEDWTAGITRLEHAEQRSLPRLGPKDLAKLLKDAFRSERLARELAMQIGEKSDGNPFFAFEIIRGLREGQFIAQQPDGTWVTTKAIEDIQVPSSVLDLVNARVADLTEQERDLLDVASCCGFEFDPTLVADIQGLPRVAALKKFGQVERRHRLVRSAGRDYRFDHHQVQEALYGSLNERLREEYHAAIGEALEVRGGAADKAQEELPGALCVQLCKHFLDGAQGSRALPYLRQATVYLAKGYLTDQAVALASRALSVPGLLVGRERLAVLTPLSHALATLGRRSEQRAVHDEARTLAAEVKPASVPLIEIEAALLEVRVGNGAEAVKRAEWAVTALHEAGDDERTRYALHIRALAYYHVGRYADAEREYRALVEAARRIRDEALEGSSVGNLALVLRRVGKTEESDACFHRASEIAARRASDADRTSALINLGTTYRRSSELERAKACFEEGRRLATACGHRLWESRALANLGHALLLENQLDEARALFEEQLVLSREIADREGESAAVTALGSMSSRRGALADALDWYARSLAMEREGGDPRGVAIATSNLGSLWSELGEPERAEPLLEEALEISRSIGIPYLEGAALLGQSLLADARGDAPSALDLAQAGLALRRGEDELGDREDLTTVARLQLRAGDREAARDALAEVLGMEDAAGEHCLSLARALQAFLGEDRSAFDGVLDVREDAHCSEILFLAWETTGRPEHLSEAKRYLDQRLAHAPEEYRESMLKNVRLNREIMEAWAEHGSPEE